jgi:hypothetical protein
VFLGGDDDGSEKEGADFSREKALSYTFFRGSREPGTRSIRTVTQEVGVGLTLNVRSFFLLSLGGWLDTYTLLGGTGRWPDMIGHNRR